MEAEQPPTARPRAKQPFDPIGAQLSSSSQRQRADSKQFSELSLLDQIRPATRIGRRAQS